MKTHFCDFIELRKEKMLKNIQTKKELKETIDKLKDIIVTLEFDQKTKVVI